MTSQKDTVARIWMSIQATSNDDFVHVVDTINAQSGMHATDLASNELAKAHLRHLAGGRADDVRWRRCWADSPLGGRERERSRAVLV